MVGRDARQRASVPRNRRNRMSCRSLNSTSSCFVSDKMYGRSKIRTEDAQKEKFLSMVRRSTIHKRRTGPLSRFLKVKATIAYRHALSITYRIARKYSQDLFGFEGDTAVCVLLH